MLRILGSKRPLCDGMQRRDFLRVGSLGMGGLTLAQLLRSQAATQAQQPGQAAPNFTTGLPSFGKAKNVILLHLYGSPSQLEWADMKPHAPVEIRGEFGGIASTLPGCDVCELLPNHAKVMDRTTVIRSMTHPYPIHGVAFALTGIPVIDVAMELSPRDGRHWPFFGSVVDYVDERTDRSRPADMPQNIALPFQFSSRRTGEVPRAGPYAAFLGTRYNPVWTDFSGTATRGIHMELAGKNFDDNEPYMGVNLADSYFHVPSATSLQPGITLDRLETRRTLLQQFDFARRNADQTNQADGADRYQQMAFSLMTSDRLRSALDVRQEAEPNRRLYGDTLFGQGCLAARRLVEAGSRVVTVMWDEYGLAGHAWDTHYNHFERMRKHLCPGFDQAWYGLITDLDQRGLLDETLVVCTSEHGRTPQINGSQGRDHWSRAYTSLMAGAGVCRGKVIGATDKIGSDVTDRPVSPKDLQATMYHLLGIDHHQTIQDNLGRPLPLVEGEVMQDALA